MPKAKKPPAIVRREKAAKILLEARRLAERGWIKEGRSSTAHALMDILEEAFAGNGGRRNLFAFSRLTPPELGLAMAYMCRCTFRDNDPGTNAGRYKQLYKQDGSAYMVAHGGVFETYRKARNLALDDLTVVREKSRVSSVVEQPPCKRQVAGSNPCTRHQIRQEK